MRHFCVVVGESDGRIGTDGKNGDPDEAIAEIRPQQRGNDDGDHDQQAAHRGRTGFLLMRLGTFFADVLADLEITQSPDDEWPDDQSREQGGEAGEGGAEGDVSKNTEGRNVMLQLQE